MYAIITYGSLVNKDEIDEMFENPTTTPIKINGFRRHFAQKSVTREGENGERGILAVTQSEDDWCNGVLITDISEEEFENYQYRERGYTQTEVEADDLEAYQEETIPNDLSKALISVGDRPLSDARPVPTYAQLCVSGAEMWGEKFLTDFLLTTYRGK